MCQPATRRAGLLSGCVAGDRLNGYRVFPVLEYGLVADARQGRRHLFQAAVVGDFKLAGLCMSCVARPPTAVETLRKPLSRRCGRDGHA